MACILLVDDEEAVRYTLRRMLERAGHDVFEATNGREALIALKSKRADLVITDIVMPVKEGTETILELRRRDPSLKIMAISGGGRTGNMDYLDVASRFGADCTLAKPVRMQELLDAVSTTLGEVA